MNLRTLTNFTAELVESLDHARVILRENVDGSLVGTPEHLQACAFIDGYCGAPMPYVVDMLQWEAWVRGRAAAVEEMNRG
jgi:hypothetical protein